ncbi:MAG TPA: MFS transporter [Chitinophagaceae bacterium]|nr:MFS transporter [Chitinophagaceae bacterium]HRF27391.1 MFS transporter [Ferruginibacter sp.]
MSEQSQRHDPYAALRLPEFRYFIAGRFVFIMGLRMTGTVIGWWVYLLTGSPLALGLVGLSEVIPAVSLALYAGQYIDRNEKRKLLLRCILLYLCCIGLFIFLSSPSMNQKLDPWTTSLIIFGVIAATGAIRSFSGPTFSSLIAHIVPRENLPSAAAISSATWLVGSICGHALAGFLIAWIGIHDSFFVVLLFTGLGYILLSRIQPKPVLVTGKANTWIRVKEGLQYVFHTKELLGAMTLDLFAVLFGGAVALVPVFAKDILQVGPIGFGWLNAAMDIGSIITVTLLTIKPLRSNQGRILFYAVAGYGVCIIFFALSNMFWLSFLALLLSGCMDGVSVIIRSTILQLKTPDELRGRVMSVSSMFINSSNELGQFESGVAARLMGTVTSVVFGGCMTIAVVLITWFKAPSLRKMEY